MTSPLDSIKAAKALAMLSLRYYVNWADYLQKFVVCSVEGLPEFYAAGTANGRNPFAGDTPIEALSTAWDAIYPGDTLSHAVVKSAPPGFFRVMGNTLYLKGAQVGTTVNGEGYLAFFGGAEILHNLKPALCGGGEPIHADQSKD